MGRASRGNANQADLRRRLGAAEAAIWRGIVGCDERRRGRQKSTNRHFRITHFFEGWRAGKRRFLETKSMAASGESIVERLDHRRLSFH